MRSQFKQEYPVAERPPPQKNQQPGMMSSLWGGGSGGTNAGGNDLGKGKGKGKGQDENRDGLMEDGRGYGRGEPPFEQPGRSEAVKERRRNGSAKVSEPKRRRRHSGPTTWQSWRLSMWYFTFTAVLFMLFWELYKPLPVFAALFQLSFVVLYDPFRSAHVLEGQGMLDLSDNILPSLSGKNAMDAMHIWLRIVCAWLGVLMGTVCGMNAEEKYMSHFFAIQFGDEYENALASTPGAAYIDAGSITFATSSKIDPAQSVGFRHGTSFCAAPIIDTNQGRKSIGYWAIGYDCCDARGQFDCGDVDGNKGARAPPDGFFYHDTGYFMSAVKQAAAVNDLELDDDIILLHWVNDPGSRKVGKFWTALGAVGLGAAIFSVLAFAIIVLTTTIEWEYTKDDSGDSLAEDLNFS